MYKEYLEYTFVSWHMDKTKNTVTVARQNEKCQARHKTELYFDL